MNELNKLELKRALEMQRGYLLSQDSLNKDVINPEFQGIDLNYQERFFNHNRPSMRAKHENNLVKQFYEGNKIILRGF